MCGCATGVWFPTVDVNVIQRLMPTDFALNALVTIENTCGQKSPVMPHLEKILTVKVFQSCLSGISKVFAPLLVFCYHVSSFAIIVSFIEKWKNKFMAFPNCDAWCVSSVIVLSGGPGVHSRSELQLEQEMLRRRLSGQRQPPAILLHQGLWY